MSKIIRFSIQNFRNLSSVTCEFSPQFNLFFGENGAGKTSILEAIYYLTLGKSFRSSQFARIIQHQSKQFILVANITDGEIQSTVGLERKVNGDRTIKLAGEKQKSIASITKLLPIQFMSPISYRFFHDGPSIRRQFLDWSLFHVEPCYLNTWQHWQRLLKQRNSALKQKQKTSIWDHELIILSEKIDLLRKKIFSLLKPLCKNLLQLLLPEFEFTLQYQRGWPQEKNLGDVLTEQLFRDQQLGYTYYGPQRADFQLFNGSTVVQDLLSQGQQKLASYALHLALGSLLQQQNQINPIYLIDDLPSELDSKNRVKIMQTLRDLHAQVFITGISVQDIIGFCGEPTHTKLFHVEHGQVSCLQTQQTTTENIVLSKN